MYPRRSFVSPSVQLITDHSFSCIWVSGIVWPVRAVTYSLEEPLFYGQMIQIIVVQLWQLGIGSSLAFTRTKDLLLIRTMCAVPPSICHVICGNSFFLQGDPKGGCDNSKVSV